MGAYAQWRHFSKTLVGGSTPAGDRSYPPWNHPRPQKILVYRVVCSRQYAYINFTYTSHTILLKIRSKHFVTSRFFTFFGVGRPIPPHPPRSLQLTPLLVFFNRTQYSMASATDAVCSTSMPIGTQLRPA